MKQSLQIGCLVANAIGGKIGPGYQAEVQRFLRTNGPEWTSRRYKAIWNAALHLRNGDRERALSIFRKYTIAYHRGSLLPKGHCGAAVRSFLQSSTSSSLRKWSALLRFYTGVTLKEASETQVAAMVQSITAPSTQIVDLVPEVYERILEMWKSHLNSPLFSEGAREVRMRSSPLPLDALKGHVSYYSPIPMPKEVRGTYYGSLVHSMLSRPWNPHTHHYQMTKLEKMGVVIPPYSREAIPDMVVGKISLLQEGGSKLRAVATPLGWVQYYFKPLHDLLETWYTSNSAVKHQERGMRFCQRRLEEGQEAYSIDLSSATDRLPRDIQCMLLQEMGLSEFPMYLDDISRSQWEVQLPDGDKVYLSYQVGQPMGLYGSYPLLDITNSLLAASAVQKVGELDTDCFRTVGDDIIFFSEKAANQYLSDLSSIGVEVSSEKTFQGRIAQFAGFLALPCSQGHAVFRPYKHSDAEYVKNPLDFLHSLGASVRNLNNGKWSPLFEDFQKSLSKRNLDLSPDLWVRDQTPLPAPRHVDHAWIKSVANKLTTSYPVEPRSLSSFVGALLASEETGFLSVRKPQPFSVPQDTNLRIHWDLDRKSGWKRTVQSLKTDPLLNPVTPDPPYHKEGKPWPPPVMDTASPSVKRRRSGHER